MQAERIGGFRLALRHRLDAAAPDFAEEGAGVQRKSDGDRNPGIDIEARKRHAVIDHEKLHQERRALKDGDVTGAGALDRRAVRDAGKRHAKAEDAAADKADDGQRKRPFQALQQEEEFVGTDGCHCLFLT